MTISLQSRDPFSPPDDRHDRRMYGSDRSPEGTRKDRSGRVQRIEHRPLGRWRATARLRRARRAQPWGRKESGVTKKKEERVR